MKTVFGIMLIVCALIYSIRVVGFIWICFSKPRRETLLAQTGISAKKYYLGGVEHLFFMVSMIGGAIILL